MTRRLVMLTLILLPALRAPALEIRLSPKTPTRGTPAVVTITEAGRPVAGVSVSATYNPKSKMAETEQLGTTDARGRVNWTPINTGIITITARKGAVHYKPEVTILLKEGGVPSAGVAVAVTYAPGSRSEKVQHLGRTGPNGEISWGLDENFVRITAKKERTEFSRNVAVRFSAFPVSGLMIFLAAGTVLYGGIILAFARMRREWDTLKKGDE